jgi:hypothetical protein
MCPNKKSNKFIYSIQVLNSYIKSRMYQQMIKIFFDDTTPNNNIWKLELQLIDGPLNLNNYFVFYFKRRGMSGFPT